MHSRPPPPRPGFDARLSHGERSRSRLDGIAFVLIAVGTLFMLGAAAASSDMLLAIGGAISGAAGLCLALSVPLSFVENFHPLRLLAATTLFAHCGGTFVSWTAAHDPEVGGFSTIRLYYGIETFDLAAALFFANVFGVLLMLVVKWRAANRVERRFAEELHRAAAAPSAARHLYPLSLLLLGLQVYSLITGQVGYRTYATSDILDIFPSLVVTIAPLSVLVTGILLARVVTRMDSGWPIAILVLSVVVNAIWFFSQGRAALLGIIIAGLLGFVLVKPLRLPQLLRAGLFIVIPTIVFASVLSQYIRYFSWADESAKENILSVVSFSVLESSQLSREERTEARGSQIENMAYRPLVANYPAELIAIWRQRGITVLGFEEIRNSFLMAVPRVLYSGKEGLMYGEVLNNARLGLPPEDNAESLLMSALMDFSIVGLFIFPALCWLYVRVFCLVALALRTASGVLLGAIALILLGMTGGETGMVTYFGTPRNVLLVAIMLFVIEKAYLSPASRSVQAVRGRRHLVR